MRMRSLVGNQQHYCRSRDSRQRERHRHGCPPVQAFTSDHRSQIQPQRPSVARSCLRGGIKPPLPSPFLPRDSLTYFISAGGPASPAKITVVITLMLTVIQPAKPPSARYRRTWTEYINAPAIVERPGISHGSRPAAKLGTTGDDDGWQRRCGPAGIDREKQHQWVSSSYGLPRPWGRNITIFNAPNALSAQLGTESHR